MKSLGYLISRNTRLFFKDRGTLLAAMIAPLILLCLFVTFLGNVYRDSLLSNLPQGISLDETLLEGFVGGWLISSLLAVSGVTVAFTANMTMVQDRINGARHDLLISPVKPSVLQLSYYFSTVLITLIICTLCLGAGLIYLYFTGWYLTAASIGLVFLDLLLVVLFGTALSSIICSFLTSQGGVSAVTSVVSSVYGFLCGAYMPISQFSKPLRNVIGCLPGTYGTSLLRNHMTADVLKAMLSAQLPADVTEGIKDVFDINLYFMDHSVGLGRMYLVMTVTIVVLVLAYIALNLIKGKARQNLN